MPRPGRANLGRSDLLFEAIQTHPEIADQLLQTFAFMMGWDDADEMWKLLAVDSNGRLELSLLSTAGDEANNSVVTVTTTTTPILADNPDRKGFIIQNNESTDLYIEFAATATTAAGLIIRQNSVFEYDRYTGPVSGITASGTVPARVVEVL